MPLASSVRPSSAFSSSENIHSHSSSSKRIKHREENAIPHTQTRSSSASRPSSAPSSSIPRSSRSSSISGRPSHVPSSSSSKTIAVSIREPIIASNSNSTAEKLSQKRQTQSSIHDILYSSPSSSSSSSSPSPSNSDSEYKPNRSWKPKKKSSLSRKSSANDKGDLYEVTVEKVLSSGPTPPPVSSSSGYQNPIAALEASLGPSSAAAASGALQRFRSAYELARSQASAALSESGKQKQRADKAEKKLEKVLNKYQEMDSDLETAIHRLRELEYENSQLRKENIDREDAFESKEDEFNRQLMTCRAQLKSLEQRLSTTTFQTKQSLDALEYLTHHLKHTLSLEQAASVGAAALSASPSSSFIPLSSKQSSKKPTTSSASIYLNSASKLADQLQTAISDLKTRFQDANPSLSSQEEAASSSSSSSSSRNNASTKKEQQEEWIAVMHNLEREREEERTHLQSEFNWMASEAQRLTSEVAHWKQSAVQLQKSEREWREQLSKLKAEAGFREDKWRAENESQLVAADSLQAELQAAHSDLERDRERAAALVNQYRIAVGRARDQIKALKKKMSERDGELQRLRTAVETLADRTQAHDKEIMVKDDMIRRLEERKRADVIRMEELEKVIKSQEKTLQEAIRQEQQPTAIRSHVPAAAAAFPIVERDAFLMKALADIERMSISISPRESAAAVAVAVASPPVPPLPLDRIVMMASSKPPLKPSPRVNLAPHPHPQRSFASVMDSKRSHDGDDEGDSSDGNASFGGFGSFSSNSNSSATQSQPSSSRLSSARKQLSPVEEQRQLDAALAASDEEESEEDEFKRLERQAQQEEQAQEALEMQEREQRRRMQLDLSQSMKKQNNSSLLSSSSVSSEKKRSAVAEMAASSLLLQQQQQQQKANSSFSSSSSLNRSSSLNAINATPPPTVIKVEPSVSSSSRKKVAVKQLNLSSASASTPRKQRTPPSSFASFVNVSAASASSSASGSTPNYSFLSNSILRQELASLDSEIVGLQQTLKNAQQMQ